MQRATHNAQTFQPYDPSETIGDTAPTTLQPTPKKNKCGVLGRVFLAIIAIVATLATRNFLVGAKILAKGSVALAAVSAATGSIVSQGVGVATGIQDKFSWNAVALNALSAGVGGVGDKFASALGATKGAAHFAVSGAVNSAAKVAAMLDDQRFQREMGWTGEGKTARKYVDAGRVLALAARKKNEG